MKPRTGSLTSCHSHGTVEILGTRIDNLSLDETVSAIDEMVAAGKFSFTITTNVDHIMKLQSDSTFRSLYSKADLVVADGVPVVWSSRILGQPLKGRVNGTDLFERLCELAAKKGYSVFFLGGNPGTAETAAKLLQERHPGLHISGVNCPPFGFEKHDVNNREIQRQIRESNSDILFVGLGSPKGEMWIANFGPGSHVKHAVGIGVSFSFVAGEIRRAPKWMQKRGLEWFWRMIKEPRRLTKRYLVDDLPFFGLLAKQLLSRTK